MRTFKYCVILVRPNCKANIEHFIGCSRKDAMESAKAYVRKMREGNLYTEVHVVRKELAPWTTVKKWSK